MTKRTVTGIIFSLSITAHLALAVPKSFLDITTQAGIPALNAATINAFDFDNDGNVDLFLGTKLYKNTSKNQKISFIDVTNEAGLAKLVGNPLFVDINNDGFVDIVTHMGQLWIQDSKHTFTEKSAGFGLLFPKPSFTVSAGDIDQDGWVDLVVGMYEREDFTFYPGKVFRNNKGTSFQDVTTQFGIDKKAAYTRGILWADYDNNGTADLFYSNYRLHENFLFKNDGKTWTDVGPTTTTAGVYDPKRFGQYGPSWGHTIGSVWTDFDNDGNFDLWVSNLVHKYVGRGDIRGYVCGDSKIYKNLGAPDFNFKDMRVLSGIHPKPIGDFDVFKGDELWSHATAADFDNDGLVDVYVPQIYDLNYAYSLLFQNKGNFRFNEIGASQGIAVFDSYAGAWADLDNDGRMDLVLAGRPVLHGTPAVKVFLNVSQNKNSFLRVKLVGNETDRNMITTQVRVKTDKGTFLRQIEGNVGTMNQQNDPVLHFGLGESKKIESIEIRWSNGRRSTIKGAGLNTTVSAFLKDAVRVARAKPAITPVKVEPTRPPSYQRPVVKGERVLATNLQGQIFWGRVTDERGPQISLEGGNYNDGWARPHLTILDGCVSGFCVGEKIVAFNIYFQAFDAEIIGITFDGNLFLSTSGGYFGTWDIERVTKKP